ncbi:hypothetical protein ACH5RR_033679 [Cinchona calisaya]|uniref:RNase H type-1 domain-containing protein n=1 Tax=Cinchona calisaya TaxID=153742 RepID=A0ABD2YE47_9GENT
MHAASSTNGQLQVLIPLSPILVAWRHPDLGSLKLNVDGSSLYGENLGVGGLIKGSSGCLILSFSNSYGIPSNMVAKLSAFRDGINIFLTHGIHKAMVESDFSFVWKLVD